MHELYLRLQNGGFTAGEALVIFINVAAFCALTGIGYTVRRMGWIVAAGAWSLLGGVFAGLSLHSGAVVLSGVAGLVVSFVGARALARKVSP